MMPRGKGIFVRHLRRHCGSHEQLVGQCQRAGISWVVVQAIWQYEDAPSKITNDGCEIYGKALAEAGIDAWVWGYPVPGAQAEFAEAMRDRAEDFGARGVIIDPEREWLHATSAEVVALVGELRLALGVPDPVPLGCSSYGAPWNFPSFPWRAFAACCDFGVPQIYDGKSRQPRDYPARSVAAWQEFGFKRIVPASAAYGRNKDGLSRRREGMEHLLDRTPVPDGAIVWWDWYNANQASGRWDAITYYDLPGTP